MPVGYYCTVMREASPRRKVGWLLGPFDDKETAESYVGVARGLAAEIDPFTAFDAFGTARLERDNLPAGILQARLEN